MPSSRPGPLPDFERPPLDEMVLSLQFADLQLMNHHAGILWLKLRDQYPKVEEQGPIAPVFETFGSLRAAPPTSEIQLLPADAMIRYWFVSPDGTQLLQIQRDRLIHNWRRRDFADSYPRYEVLRKRFEAEIRLVQEFLREYGLGEIRCNQCEVSYINAIGPNEITDDPNRDLDKIFTLWCERYNYDGLDHIERGRFGATYLMRVEGGEAPIGRIHINASPGIRTRDSVPVVQLNITARGKPQDETVAAAFSWLDQGHISIVRSFSAITTKEMHRIWGRTDAQ